MGLAEKLRGYVPPPIRIAHYLISVWISRPELMPHLVTMVETGDCGLSGHERKLVNNMIQKMAVHTAGRARLRAILPQLARAVMARVPPGQCPVCGAPRPPAGHAYGRCKSGIRRIAERIAREAGYVF